MTTRDYRDIRDHRMGTDRNNLYGSDRAYYPFPHKLSSKAGLSKFGTPGSLVRNNTDSLETTNYEHMQNFKELSRLLAATN